MGILIDTEVYETLQVRFEDDICFIQIHRPEANNAINDDLIAGKKPFLVIGNAGDVSMGTVDNLSEIAAICKSHDLWFHIDGAYGIPAAAIPKLKSLFGGIQEADSIALDPHKWLFAPMAPAHLFVHLHSTRLIANICSGILNN